MVPFLGTRAACKPVSPRLAAAVVAVLGLFVDRANALSCAYEPVRLQDAYARASGIVVAQVLGCADGALPANGRCPDAHYHLETLEVLKAPEPWRNLSGAHSGTDGMTRCGQSFALGESYLLFFTESGSIMTSIGGALKGARLETKEIQQTLEMLRAYRDGRIVELADPWIFTRSRLSCDLRQRVAGHEIQFLYPFVQPLGERARAFVVEFDEDGNPTMTDTGPVPQLQGMVPRIDGPQFEPHAINLSVAFLYYEQTEPDTAALAVAEDTWELRTQTLTMSSDGREIAKVALDLARRGDAREIFEAMLEPAAVVVTKRRASAPQTIPTPVAEPEDLIVETSSAQFASEAAKFTACIADGAPAGL